MLVTAVVRFELVGVVISAPYNNPVTCGEVADVVPTMVNEKPVMNDVAAGLSPTSPVITEAGTVETFDVARIT
jgi:hypothetical protein